MKFASLGGPMTGTTILHNLSLYVPDFPLGIQPMTHLLQDRCAVHISHVGMHQT